MKKAIISGATGLVGRSVARYLASNDVDVLCLGRQDFTPESTNEFFGEGVKYIQLDMKNISQLSDKIKYLNWKVGHDCVFYNFAWSGVTNLTDGNFEDQLRNAVFSSLAVKSAKKIGCSKFVNSGTLEETYAEWHLNNGLPYSSTQGDYAIAKLASRDMCTMVSYLEKVDYIHTRLSVPLSPDLSVEGFISKTLKKIRDKESYEPAKNNQLFDIISTNDVARAYHLIGLYGKNKANYFIGSGKPVKLNDYFENFRQADLGKLIKEQEYSSSNVLSFFSTKELQIDTGFLALSNQFNLLGIKKIK
jgi:nucleoside-diphosphate-sugar epimerase